MKYEEDSFPVKKAILLAILIIAIVAAFCCAPQLYENIHMGKYHITQSPFSGEITARMTPGPYAQWFSSIEEFPVSETFFFTHDKEGGSEDTSITVQFNDGSTCKISGTCRVDLPRDGELAKKLVTEHGYKNMDQIEDRLILPTIRRSLMLTANQMTAKESYAEKRSQFIADAWDQIINGVYIMKDVIEKVNDPISGKEVTRITKTPVVNEKGIRLREKNPFDDLGITLANFEVKSFLYEDKVKSQIAAQQQALMDVQTAKANLLKAEQDALTAEKQGQAKVMLAKYEEEQKKIRAEVQAQQDLSVATINAQKLVDVANKEKEQALIVANKEKDVASINLEAAKLEKQKLIELGTGQAEAKKLIMTADGALAQKLDALIKINEYWAKAFSTRPVPSIVTGGQGSTDKDTIGFMEILGAKAAKDLSVELNTQKK